MLRIQRKGGEEVGKGTYWRVSDGERVSLSEDGTLPGDATETYLRFHPAFMLIVGPFLGLVYAIFMPLTAILMVIWVACEKLFSYSATALQRAALGWRPSEAYSTGRKTDGVNEEETRAGGEALKEKPADPPSDPLAVTIHLDWSENCSKTEGRSTERTDGK